MILKAQVKKKSIEGVALREGKKCFFQSEIPPFSQKLTEYGSKAEAEVIAHIIKSKGAQVDITDALSQCAYIDIETLTVPNAFPHPLKEAIFSIAIKPHGKNVVLVLFLITNENYHKNTLERVELVHSGSTYEIYYKTFLSEKSMLEYFWNLIKNKFTFILAWNGYQFDFPYLLIRSVNVFEIPVIKKESLPDWIKVRKISERNLPFYFHYRSPIDIEMLDYKHLYKTYVAHKELESYRLDVVAKKETGQGKLDVDVRFFTEIPEKPDPLVIQYNAVDVILMNEIEKNSNIMPTLFEMARLSNLTPALALNASNIIIGNIIDKLGDRYLKYVASVAAINEMFKNIPD